MGFLLCAGFYLSQRNREPSYEGETLSQWIGPRTWPGNKAERDAEVEKAIRSMGTNAIPFLLKWMQLEPPRTMAESIRSRLLQVPGLKIPAAYFYSEYDRYCHRKFLKEVEAEASRRNQNSDRSCLPQRWPPPRYTAADYRACVTPLAFTRLGPAATNALPELIRLFNSPKFTIAARAGKALAWMGPVGVPPLAAALGSTNELFRNLAAQMLWEAGPNALTLEPNLFVPPSDYESEAERIQRMGVVSFQQMEVVSFKPKPAAIVPVMVSWLTSDDSKRRSLAEREDRRARSTECLREYGSSAKSAVPILVEALNHTNPAIQNAARTVLLRISPESVTNAPPR